MINLIDFDRLGYTDSFELLKGVYQNRVSARWLFGSNAIKSDTFCSSTAKAHIRRVINGDTHILYAIQNLQGENLGIVGAHWESFMGLNGGNSITTLECSLLPLSKLKLIKNRLNKVKGRNVGASALVQLCWGLAAITDIRQFYSIVLPGNVKACQMNLKAGFKDTGIKVKKGNTTYDSLVLSL